MNLRNIIAVNAVVACVFGLALMLYPGFMMSAYGVTQIPEGRALTRLFGTTLLSFGLVMWFVKDAAMSAARRNVTLALLSANIIGLLITLLQQQAIWSVKSALVGWAHSGRLPCFRRRLRLSRDENGRLTARLETHIKRFHTRFLSEALAVEWAPGGAVPTRSTHHAIC